MTPFYHSSLQMFDAFSGEDSQKEEEEKEAKDRVVEKETKHAPDLLDGPDINEDGV